MPINITTAVDSLVELINAKKRISLEDAAHELGLPEHIINEWAVFLEEEKILNIEYQFTTPFLVIRAKESNEKEDYSRDIEIKTRGLEIIFSGLNKIEIKHNIKIKNIEEIRGLVKRKTKLDNDVVYAQKFVLQYKIKRLLNKIQKLKAYKKKDYEEINEEFDDIMKKNLIFEKNLKKLK